MRKYNRKKNEPHILKFRTEEEEEEKKRIPEKQKKKKTNALKLVFLALFWEEWERNRTNSTLCIQSKQQMMRNIEEKKDHSIRWYL